MQIWNGICTLNFDNNMNIRTTAFQIILQFMNHCSIFDKRNSIKVYFIVHSKLDVIPVLFCNRWKCGTFASNIKMSSRFKLSSINNFTLH
nr:hypothetical protein Iba_chr02aCG13450 [Ipomoea batatas]